MSHSEVLSPTGAVAAQLKVLRKGLGWSAARMAEAMAAEGFRWDRFTVSNFENGRRQSLSLDELFALALVLGVAPVHLMVPVDDNVVVQVTPGVVTQPTRLRAWIRGSSPFVQEADDEYDMSAPAWRAYLAHMPPAEARGVIEGRTVEGQLTARAQAALDSVEDFTNEMEEMRQQTEMDRRNLAKLVAEAESALEQLNAQVATRR